MAGVTKNRGRSRIFSSYDTAASYASLPKVVGTTHLCPDWIFRGLNQITKKNCYPLPLISKSINCLASPGYFTKLDIRKAYIRL
jgi:hypothetical protein